MKIVKKILKYLAILIVVLIGAAIILPIVFEDEIVAIVKEQANENLNAEVDFGEYDLSLLSTFPNFGLEVNDVVVKNKKPFEGVTLANIGTTVVTIDLMSVINGDKYEIKKVGLVNPDIHVEVMKDGTANWDIMKASADTAAEPEEAEPDTGAPMRIGLEEYYIENANVIYNDTSLSMYTHLKGFTHRGSGDFTLSNFTLETHTTIDTADFIFDGVKYADQVNLEMDADLGMDMENFKFTFKENVLRMNELELGFDGYFAMPESGFDMDITYSTKKTAFRTILSMVPAVYTESFADVKTSGNLALKGYIKGRYTDDLMPGFGLDLKVEDGSFDYPDLPKSAKNIQVDLKVDRKEGPDLDNTIVDLSRFHVELADNPVDMELKLLTPISDPDIDCSVKAQLDLSTLQEVVPMEGTEYNGNLTADVNLAGKMSTIENENYQDFKAEGKFILLDMLYESKDLPYNVAIKKTYFNFSPRYLELAKFESTIGKSDLKANGRIDNYLAYALKDETLKGNFQLNSNRFDLNELMGTTEEGAEGDGSGSSETSSDTAGTAEEMAVLEVPGNIDFSMGARFGKLLYDDISMDNVKGKVEVENKVAKLTDLRMGILGGNVVVNGSYGTKNPEKPKVDFKYDIENMDINKTATTFNTVDKLAPIAKNCTGRFSSDMTFRTDLKSNMDPDYDSMEGNGTLRSKEVYVEGFEPLNKLADKLGIDRLAKQNIEDVKVKFEFHDGKVYVEPFDVELSGMKATIQGNTSFEQELDYTIDMEVPRNKLGGTANQAIEGLISKANQQGANLSVGETVPVKIAVKGTVSDPRIGLGVEGKDGQSVQEQVKEKVKEEVKEEAKKQAKKLIEDARKRGDKLVKEAEQKAERIRKEARKKADQASKKIINEAEKEGDKLVDEANNPIAKAAAKETKKRLIKEAKKEADKKADRIEKEADKRADRIVNEAKKEKQKMIEEAKKKAEEQ